jgi:fumarate reductase subunit C
MVRVSGIQQLNVTVNFLEFLNAPLAVGNNLVSAATAMIGVRPSLNIVRRVVQIQLASGAPKNISHATANHGVHL